MDAAPSEASEPLPSIELPKASCWRLVFAISLLLASPVILAIAHLFRTGRDLTLPFAIAEGLVLLTGTFVLACGLWRRNGIQVGVGAVSALLAVAFAWGAGGYMLGSGSRDIEFTVMVTDAITDQTIADATVTFFREEFKEEILATQKTNPEGVAKLTVRCPVGSKTSPVCHTGNAVFYSVSTRTSATNYRDLRSPLWELAGLGGSVLDLPPPPHPHPTAADVILRWSCTRA